MSDIDERLTRLERIADRIEIEECIIRVSRGIDRHDAALALSGFHEGAMDDHGSFIGTGAEAVAWAERLHDSTLRSHQHHLSNMSIDIDRDEAHAETYVWVVSTPKDGWTYAAGGGRYLDRLEKRDGEWKIVDRVLTVEWWTDPDKVERMNSLVVPFTQDEHDPSYARPLRVTRQPRDLSAARNGLAARRSPTSSSG